MAGQKNPRIQYLCSFCSKSQEQVHRLIAGPGGVYICNECIDLCQEIIGEDAPPPGGRLPTSGRTEQARLRSSALSGARAVHRLLATRDYGEAITEAEALLERVRTLQGLASANPEMQDPLRE